MGLLNKKEDILKEMMQLAIQKNKNMSYILDKIDVEEYKRKFQDDKILGKLFVSIAFNEIDRSYDAIDYLDDVFMIYNDIVKHGTTEEKELFIRIHNALDNYIPYELFLTVYNHLSPAFDNKELIIESVHSLNKIIDENIDSNKDNLEIILSYPRQARAYYIDDRSLLCSFINLLNTPNLENYLYTTASVEKIINEKLTEDRKQNGIYDIDRGTLEELSEKLDQINDESSDLKMLLNTASTLIVELQSETKTSKDEISKLKLKSLKELQRKANQTIEDFHVRYLELLSEEKSTMNTQKQELMSEFQRELSKKTSELRALAKQIDSTTQIEIDRINSTTSSSIERLETFLNDNNMIKELINQTKENDSYLDTLKFISSKLKEKQNNSLEKNNIIIPTILTKEQRTIGDKINYYFDNKISFNERFDHLMKEKENDIKNGNIYHEKFDDIAKLIMIGQVPYMYGPSGCGKTYMIEKQLSKLLGANVVTNGYVLYEQDIIGYTNSATGQYVPSNFYRCYKYGDIIFLDEIDNGIANATVVLNNFLGKYNTSYTFPDGLITKRHPNFRIITAGNTNGNGRTAAYNTRQKMDESLLQRLTPVFVNYDNRVEKEILKDYPDWYHFSICYRKAIENMSNNSEEINTTGTFTTRDAESIKEYLDSKVFTDEKILELQYIQTKDIDSLNGILTYMNHHINSYQDKSMKILRKFNSLIENKINSRL